MRSVEATDLATVAAALGDELRRADVPVTGEQLSRFVRAVSLTAPATDTELYWLARVTLVRAPDQLEGFDAVFNRIFHGIVDIADSRGDANAPGTGAPVTRRAPRD